MRYTRENFDSVMNAAHQVQKAYSAIMAIRDPDSRNDRDRGLDTVLVELKDEAAHINSVRNQVIDDLGPEAEHL